MKKKYIELDPQVQAAVSADLERKQNEMCAYATRAESSMRREEEKFRIQRPNFSKDS